MQRTEREALVCRTPLRSKSGSSCEGITAHNSCVAPDNRNGGGEGGRGDGQIRGFGKQPVEGEGRKTAVHEAGRTVYDRSSSLLLDYMGCTED